MVILVCSVCTNDLPVKGTFKLVFTFVYTKVYIFLTNWWYNVFLLINQSQRIYSVTNKYFNNKSIKVILQASKQKNMYILNCIHNFLLKTIRVFFWTPNNSQLSQNSVKTHQMIVIIRYQQWISEKVIVNRTLYRIFI